MCFRVIAFLIFLAGAGLMVGIAARTSVNRTEVAHLGAAAYFTQTGKYDLFHVNPPLGRMASGLPIFLAGAKTDLTSYSPRPQDRSEWNVGAGLIAANEPTEVRRMVFLARCMFVPIILLGGWFGFLLATELYGDAAGLVFTILWSFSPLFLGWGATLCPDMAAASLGVVAVYWFRRWLQSPTWKHVVIAGFCVGLLPLAKLTWIVAFGIFPVLWIVARNRPKGTQLLVAMLLALYTLNMGYLFDGSFKPLKDYSFISQSLRGESDNRFTESWLGNIPVPFPAEFVQGFDTQKRDFEKGLESYLFGKYSDRGWWYYYPVVLALKEPLGTLGLLGLAVGLTLGGAAYRLPWRDEFFVLFPFAVLFGVICTQTGFSIHPRYLLPAMPFLYLLIARTGKAFQLPGKALKVAVASCLIFMIGSSLYAWPYSMSFMNEAVPLSQRPKLLLGSNLDWGQDAYFLKDYLKQHPEVENIKIEYPCPEGIERIGIASAGTPPTEPEPGWFALGVNDIYAASERFAWFKRTSPVAFVGYSIYVYHITAVEAERLQTETTNHGKH